MRASFSIALLICLASAQQRGMLTVNISDVNEAISPELFGLNLEFTRHDLWEGLSAQLIANRQFAVQPPGTTWPIPWPAGFPPRWTPIGSPSITSMQQGVRCVLSPAAPLCGLQQSPVQDGFHAGISWGSAIGVQEGQSYSFQLAASTSGVSSIIVSVELVGILAGSLTLPGDGVQHTLSWNFTSPETSPNSTLLIYVNGSAGIVDLYATSLLPVQGTFLGTMRADTVSALKSLTFHGPLRYPGGCFTPFYNWKAQLQPYVTRQTTFTPPGYCTAVAGGVNTYSDGFMENGLSVDEYFALTQEIGATMSITLPLQYGTPDEIQNAVDLVEYCNGPTNSTWGSLRAARGFPAPFGVQLWYLGNEMNQQLRYPNYPANIASDPPPSAQLYAGMISTLAPALLAVDPSLRLFAVSGDSGWNSAWAQHSVGALVAATSYHGGYASVNPAVTPQDYTSQAKIPSTGVLADMTSVRAALDSVNGSHVALSADEWGLGPPWTVATFNVAHGMYGASFLSMIVKNAAALNVAYSNYFEPINEGGIVVGQFPGSAALTPLGIVMPFFSNYSGTVRLGYALGPGTQPAGTEDDIDVLVSMARLPGGVDGVLLTLTNRNATALYTQPVTLVGEQSQLFGKQASVSLLTASGLQPGSVFIPSSTSEPVTVLGPGQAQVVFSVPAYSILQAVIPLESA